MGFLAIYLVLWVIRDWPSISKSNLEDQHITPPDSSAFIILVRTILPVVKLLPAHRNMALHSAKVAFHNWERRISTFNYTLMIKILQKYARLHIINWILFLLVTNSYLLNSSEELIKKKLTPTTHVRIKWSYMSRIVFQLIMKYFYKYQYFHEFSIYKKKKTFQI